jgi:CheY-like chemotaxis protein
MAHVILAAAGYRVLEAESGAAAIRVWEEHHDEIALLLADVIMPGGVTGVELAQQLQARKPELGIVFASGYSMENLDAAVLRSSRAVILPKPYTHITLTRAIRECLDQRQGQP